MDQDSYWRQVTTDLLSLRKSDKVDVPIVDIKLSTHVEKYKHLGGHVMNLFQSQKASHGATWQLLHF